MFNSNFKTISHLANLDDALIKRKSGSLLQTVTNEEFNIMMHLIEITHSIVNIDCSKHISTSRDTKFLRLL